MRVDEDTRTVWIKTRLKNNPEPTPADLGRAPIMRQQQKQSKSPGFGDRVVASGSVSSRAAPGTHCFVP